MRSGAGGSEPRASSRARERVEVRRYDPSRRLAYRLALAVAALLLLAGAFALGRFSMAPGPAEPGASRGELEAELRSRGDELEMLEQQLANLQAAARIEREAVATVRADLAESQATVERLGREVELFRSLMDGSARTRGVEVYRLDIQPGAAPLEFRYRVTLLQRAQKHAELGGSLRFAVEGVQGGKPRTLGGAELAMPGGAERLPLKMLYFQVLDGTWRLPDGFEPRRVRILVDITKGRPQKLDLRRDWKVGES